MNLYELATELRTLEVAIEENPETNLVEALEALKLDEKAMTGGIVRWMENLDAFAEALKAEEKKLSDKRKAMENRGASLKQYLIDFMVKTNQKKLDCGIRKASLLDPKASVKVDLAEVANWPDEAIEAAVSYEPKVNLNGLKRFPGFDKLPGVSEVMGKTSIRIA
jgi:hypothetical protein